nr:MAG TPA: Minor capsid protein [Bacteriophage sp.]
MSSPVRELQFFGAPMRGKKFFDRMKSDHKEDILKATQALIDRGGT